MKNYTIGAFLDKSTTELERAPLSLTFRWDLELSKQSDQRFSKFERWMIHSQFIKECHNIKIAIPRQLLISINSYDITYLLGLFNDFFAYILQNKWKKLKLCIKKL